jgi:hypothetical protein
MEICEVEPLISPQNAWFDFINYVACGNLSCCDYQLFIVIYVIIYWSSFFYDKIQILGIY